MFGSGWTPRRTGGRLVLQCTFRSHLATAADTFFREKAYVMSAIDAVWAHMKLTAREYAGQGVRPSPIQAQGIVSQLMRENKVSPWPPPGVIEYFASEMIAMIDQSEHVASRV